jgi:hypothetical protein
MTARTPTIEDDLASALAIIRDLSLGYPWKEMGLDDAGMEEFFTRAVTRIEPDPAARADEWACPLLAPSYPE